MKIPILILLWIVVNTLDTFRFFFTFLEGGQIVSPVDRVSASWSTWWLEVLRNDARPSWARFIRRIDHPELELLYTTVFHPLMTPAWVAPLLGFCGSPFAIVPLSESCLHIKINPLFNFMLNFEYNAILWTKMNGSECPLGQGSVDRTVVKFSIVKNQSMAFGFSFGGQKTPDRK